MWGVLEKVVTFYMICMDALGKLCVGVGRIWKNKLLDVGIGLQGGAEYY